MKISKALTIASLRIAVAMGVVVCTAALITVPAHAKAIGETPNKAGGFVTVYDDPCPGGPPDSFLAEAFSPKDGVSFGCWKVESKTTLRIYWLMETDDGKPFTVPLIYNIKGFSNPTNL